MYLVKKVSSTLLGSLDRFCDRSARLRNIANARGERNRRSQGALFESEGAACTLGRTRRLSQRDEWGVFLISTQHMPPVRGPSS